MGARDFFLFSQMGERSSMCERTEKDPIESRERGGGPREVPGAASGANMKRGWL